MTTQNQPDLLYIDSIDTFVRALTTWHRHKVQVLEHMMEIPSGTEMEVNDSKLTLEGEVLKGFCAGIMVALSELGELPFEFEIEKASKVTQPPAINDPAAIIH